MDIEHKAEKIGAIGLCAGCIGLFVLTIYFISGQSDPGNFLFFNSGKNSAPDNPYIGNMKDFSYSGQRTAEGVVYRINAEGEKVSVIQFEGRFIWTNFAAPWCGNSASQAQVIKNLENSFGDEVVFLTVMTSASPEYESLPTRQTAKEWAQRFGLNPNKVVAAANLWAQTVPTHILYSSTGQTLYRSKGYMSHDQIKDILSRYMQDWKNWADNGKKADWMRFTE